MARDWESAAKEWEAAATSWQAAAQRFEASANRLLEIVRMYEAIFLEERGRLDAVPRAAGEETKAS